MNLPHLVIFDMDGLIFDTERLFMDFLKEQAKIRGYEISDEQYISTLGLSGHALKNRMISYFGKGYPFEDISSDARASLNIYAQKNVLPVKKGITELLSFFRERGIPCACASASPRSAVKSYLESTGLDCYFSFAVGGDMVVRGKPDPEIFTAVCDHFKIAPSQALVLEDSENGIMAAYNGKIPVVCIPDLKYPDKQYRDLCLKVIDNALSLVTYFSED